MKRLIAMVLALTMMLTASASLADADGESSTLLTEEPVTMTYFVPFSSEIIQTLNDNVMYQELERRTGVHIEFIHPAGDTQSAFNLLIATDEIPDMFEDCISYYSAGPDGLIEDGIALRLNDYEDLLPNYMAILNEYPDIAKDVTTDNGNMAAFYCVQTTLEEPWDGMRIRQDWLDELNLEMPQTISEFEEVLRAFKEQKGASVPMTMYNSWKEQYGYFVGAWDIGPSFYNVDGEVRFGPIQPEYKEYLTTMARWYADGLMDNEYLTRNGTDAAVEELIANDQVGVFNETYNADYYDIKVALPFLTLERGQTRHFSLYNRRIKNANEVIVTTACENPELAMKWMDYHYSEEGSELFNYGVEGISYEVVDGQKQWTDLMINNPDGYNIIDLCYVYKWHQGAYNRDPSAYPAYTESYITEMSVWGSNTDGAYVMPPITLTADESSRYSEIMADIETYVSTMTNRYIMGLESLDTFDSFVEQIEKMNIAEATSIEQAALDRYNAR